MKIIIFICFACIKLQVATGQCVSRQPNILYNRQAEVMEQPMYITQPQSSVFQTVRELTIPASQIKEVQPYLNPTTLITDCTPSVCKTLIDVIQLMSVATLIKDKRGGPDVALQMAEPFLKELMLNRPMSPINPGFVPAYSNQIISPDFVNPNFVSSCPNQVPPNLISPIPPFYPNFVTSPNVISNLPIPTRAISNGNANLLVNNLLNMLGK